MKNSQNEYSIILSQATLASIDDYAKHLSQGGEAGFNLANVIRDTKQNSLDKWQLLSALLNSKKTQISAESHVSGDGSDWTSGELSILGDISIGMRVSIFDNGAHQSPAVHNAPFIGHLIYMPGALLRNDRGYTPADWNAVTVEDEVNTDKYYALYERRLLPAFCFINECTEKRGFPAFITIPGIGCGQFAGPFRGQMGHLFQAVLIRFLKTHGEKFSGIKVVYYDPYNECTDETQVISGIQFMVRPLTQNNGGKSQLCKPTFLGQDIEDNFESCELYSFVAWDHVSWPGNDYYMGARMTDDGVKAAATNSMEVMTGVVGNYCERKKMYCAPEPYWNWKEVVVKNNLKIIATHNLRIVQQTEN